MSRVETLVNLALGESIVLAGLHAESESRRREGLPILSQIPVLGYLFGSQGLRDERTENLLFIVPTVVEAVELEERDRVHEAYTAYRRFSGNFGRPLLERAETETRPEESREE